MKAKAHTSVLRLEKSEKDVFFVSPRKVIRYKCTKLLLMGSCAFFEPSQGYIKKKNVFKTVLLGISNFGVRIFEKYESQKKIKTVLKSPGRGL